MNDCEVILARNLDADNVCDILVYAIYYDRKLLQVKKNKFAFFFVLNIYNTKKELLRCVYRVAAHVRFANDSSVAQSEISRNERQGCDQVCHRLDCTLQQTRRRRSIADVSICASSATLQHCNEKLVNQHNYFQKLSLIFNGDRFTR